MSARTCVVSFFSSGIKHSAEVTAETLYEAAVVGVKAISEQWGEEPGPTTPLHVEVRAPSVTHEITVNQVRQWLDGTCKSPREKILKDPLNRIAGRLKQWSSI